MNPDQKRFHSLTVKGMAKAGSQQVLAAAIGVSQMTISRWISSPPAEPKVKFVRKLETYLKKANK